MKPPISPPCRIIREGGSSGICDICGSSLKRRWFGLGKVIGCLQPKCWNWHGWSHLPAGHNRPIDLYGAPEKPPYGLPTPKRYPPMPAVVPPCELRAALTKIRTAGYNWDPTAQWMQKVAAHALEPGKWSDPGEQLATVPGNGDGFSTTQLRGMFAPYEYHNRGRGPDMFEVERFLDWIDQGGAA